MSDRVRTLVESATADCDTVLREAALCRLDALRLADSDLVLDEREMPSEAASALVDAVCYLCAELAWRDTPELRDAIRLAVLAWKVMT
jgi:hypothetical protein